MTLRRSSSEKPWPWKTLEEVLQKFKLLGVVYEGERPQSKGDNADCRFERGRNESGREHKESPAVYGSGQAESRTLPMVWIFSLGAGRSSFFAKTAAYAGPAATIRQLYWMTGILLLGMALGLVILENRLLRRPVDGIIQDLHRGTAPKYRGVEEF